MRNVVALLCLAVLRVGNARLEHRDAFLELDTLLVPAHVALKHEIAFLEMIVFLHVALDARLDLGQLVSLADQRSVPLAQLRVASSMLRLLQKAGGRHARKVRDAVLRKECTEIADLDVKGRDGLGDFLRACVAAVEHPVARVCLAK